MGEGAEGSLGGSLKDPWVRELKAVAGGGGQGELRKRLIEGSMGGQKEGTALSPCCPGPLWSNFLWHSQLK